MQPGMRPMSPRSDGGHGPTRGQDGQEYKKLPKTCHSYSIPSSLSRRARATIPHAACQIETFTEHNQRSTENSCSATCDRCEIVQLIRPLKNKLSETGGVETGCNDLHIYIYINMIQSIQ